MKKPILIIAALAFVAANLFTGCESAEKKVSKAEQEVLDANKKLDQEKSDLALQKSQDARDWKTFKKESTDRIESNDQKIAELKAKLNTSGKLTDAVYQERIITLEKKNLELKKRMETYDANKNDWESFKREFVKDMENLGEALQGLTVDSNK